ncbi:MAG: DUF3473 domain-containing protein [Gammaproteobacteria bacterium]|nr:DUF3473 domain-containing protein [Gammaproteobacteria bacterium]
MTRAHALTVDVEDYYHATAVESVLPRSQWQDLPERVQDNTRKVLELFAASGVQATFFVLGVVARRHPGLIREIVLAGHEVACHGLSHKLVYQQSPEEFASETRDAKKIIEDAIGDEISGYRAASYSITRRSLWALDVLAEAGFKYDSSIFPIRHDRYGLTGVEINPHCAKTPAGYAIMEWPITVTNILGFTLPVTGGGYFRLYPEILSRYLFRYVSARQQRRFMFYFHPWEIDRDHPEVGLKGFSRFRHYNNIERYAGRIKRLLAEFEFSPVKEIVESACAGRSFDYSLL